MPPPKAMSGVAINYQGGLGNPPRKTVTRWAVGPAAGSLIPSCNDGLDSPGDSDSFLDGTQTGSWAYQYPGGRGRRVAVHSFISPIHPFTLRGLL